VPSSPNSFDTDAGRECRRHGVPVASRPYEVLDVVPSSPNSFDTDAGRECRRHGVPVASRPYEVLDVVPSSPNSFDTGAGRECRRHGVPVASRPYEEFASLPRRGGRRPADSNARSAPVLRSGRRALQHRVPSSCVQWHFVLSTCGVRASPCGRHGRRRIGSHLRLFWTHEQVVSFQK
jgi:flavin-binding protein dodecin